MSSDGIVMLLHWGSFKNYVDKIRLVGGQKCLFLSTIRVKNVNTEVGT